MRNKLRASPIYKIGLVLSALTLGSVAALAQSETIDLTVCNNSSLCNGTTVLATVTKTQVAGNQVDFSVSGQNGYSLQNAGNVFGFNSTISGLSITNISPSTDSAGGAGNLNGFGSFNYTINSSAGGNPTISSLTFDVTNSSGTLSLAQVDVTNASGWEFAAHISNPGNTLTGFGTGPVPETTSISLFGSALLLAGIWVRKRLPNHPA